MSTGIKSLAQVEREAIEHAIAVTGAPAKAAKALGIGKTTLYRKLALYHTEDECHRLASGSKAEHSPNSAASATSATRADASNAVAR